MVKSMLQLGFSCAAAAASIVSPLGVKGPCTLLGVMCLAGSFLVVVLVVWNAC